MGLTVSGMANEIEKALAHVWPIYEGINEPSAGANERHMLAVAISRGVLQYLSDQQSTIIESISVKMPLTVNDLKLDITIDA